MRDKITTFKRFNHSITHTYTQSDLFNALSRKWDFRVVETVDIILTI